MSISAVLVFFSAIFQYGFHFYLKGLLTPQQEEAVKNCIEKLNNLLVCATKKRPDGPPSLLGSTSNLGTSASDEADLEKEKIKSFLAEQLAKQLVIRGMKNIDDWELHKIVYSIAEKSALDDGTLAPPPKNRPAPPPQPQHDFYDNYGMQGYSTGMPPPTNEPP